MNIEKCKNNHFFDTDSYPRCPICGETIAVKNIKSDKSRKRILGKFRKFRNSEKNSKTKQEKEKRESFGVINSGSDIIDDDMTISLAYPDEGKKQNGGFFNELMIDEIPVDGDVATEGYVQFNDKTVEMPFRQEENISDIDSESLRSAVRKVSSSADGKTFSYFSFGTKQENMNEVQIPVSELIVGIFACIKGPHIGECFYIFSGRNSIGRSGDNRIVLLKDNHVSRYKHAFITYEPRKREFFIQPGDGNGLIYHNGANLFETKKMSAKDEIELGQSVLKLFPLCDDDFSWEDYMK